jgi:hypothetical protein
MVKNMSGNRALETEKNLENFTSLPLGVAIPVAVMLLSPTQIDDGRGPKVATPISACVDQSGKLLIIDGHHRWYDMQKRGPGFRKIITRKVENPFI